MPRFHDVKTHDIEVEVGMCAGSHTWDMELRGVRQGALNCPSERKNVGS